MQRELTDLEITSKPGWATHYIVTNDDVIVYQSLKYFQIGEAGRRLKSGGYLDPGANLIPNVCGVGQSKSDSVKESLTNIFIGMGVALASQLVWFPLIDKSFTLGENLATTAFFTLVSFVRSYSLRRIFNKRTIKESHEN